MRPDGQRLRRIVPGTVPLLVLWSAAASADPAAPAALEPAGPMASYSDVGAAGARQETPVAQLAVAIVNGQERDNAIAVITTPDRSTLVALDYLVAALSLRAEKTDAGYSVETPLGKALVPAGALQVIQGYTYVDTKTLSRVFAADIRFDASEFAVRVDIPWEPVDRDANPKDAKDRSAKIIVPDVYAPKASLSMWRTQVDFRHDDLGNTTTSTTELGGALGPGAWRVRYLEDFQNNRSFDTWTWVAGRGNTRYLLGRQLVSLNSLLPSFYLTGGQVAYSNQPRAMFDASRGEELIASRLNSPRTVRGKGPPGGTAELRRDGQVLGRQPIQLDGTYEFRDLDLGGSRIEVAVFDRGNPQTPVRVDALYEQASDQLLPKGAYVHYAGIGTTGNPLDPNNVGGERAGFYQYRQGINEHLTAVATVESLAGQRQAMAGAVVVIPKLGAWAVSGASGVDGNATQVIGNGAAGRVFWRAGARHDEAGFSAEGSPEQTDDYGEVGWYAASNLQASLVARHYRGTLSKDVDYLKPAVSWQPTRNLGLNARPDFDGRYTIFAGYTPAPTWRIGLTRFGSRSDIDVEKRLPDDFSVRGQYSDAGDLGHREAVYLEAARFRNLPVGWSVGLLRANGSTGYLVDASGELHPGVTLHAQMFDDPLQNRDANSPGRVFSLSLVLDFAVTPSGLARGAFRAEQLNRGGISGRIEMGGQPFDARRTEGVGVLINGRVAGEVDAGGHFLLPNLPDGIYALQLDTEKLPLEYQPVDRIRRVQVRGGAVTHVDFNIELRLGFAGRVTRAGRPPDATVGIKVTDAAGQTVGQVNADSYGYYRLDGLPPGHYSIDAQIDAGAPLAHREFDLRDQFLFGQDLDLGGTK